MNPAQRDESLPPEAIRLLNAVVDETASPSEYAQFELLLQSSSTARRRYLDASHLHATLRWIHRGEMGAPAASSTTLDQVVERALQGPAVSGDVELPSSLIHELREPIAGRRRASMARSWIGLVLIGAVLLSVWGARQYQAGVEKRQEKIVALTPVADVQSQRNCVWLNQSQPLPAGSSLTSGQRLQLSSGSAKLLFRRGAAVVLEGPAEIELISAVSMRLVHGTVAVRVSGPDKEFVVISPDASIVDLGTSFGVHRGVNGSTEVEVFEGAVEVFPQGDDSNGRVLGVGASARVHGDNRATKLEMGASSTDHFGNLLEMLWDDVPNDQFDRADGGRHNSVNSDFSDGPVPGAVDTFYGAVPGRGWLTPWMASGNPIGDLTDANPLSIGNPLYLGLRFHHSYERAVARLYGERPGFDPAKPHVISWRWRFDGNIEHFAGSYRDRIAFYGNPFFRRNSWPTNTWVVGVVAGHEVGGKERQMLPMQWYAFDGHADGHDKELDRRNMVDSGMMLKAGVVYRLAVAVYPQERRYDVAIRDDVRTFTRRGLGFRDPTLADARVIHLTVSADNPDDDLSFSIDSLRVEPLVEGPMRAQFARDEDESVVPDRPAL